MIFGAKNSFLKYIFRLVSVPTKPSFQFLCKLPVEGRTSSLKPATPKKLLALELVVRVHLPKASFLTIKSFSGKVLSKAFQNMKQMVVILRNSLYLDIIYFVLSLN